MAIQLTAADAKTSLTGHVFSKGEEICARFGPGLGWKELELLIEDRTLVRYPVEVVFDAAQLNPGEFAHPVPKGDRPEDGFLMCVHPLYMTQLQRVPYLVLYQLVAVNYGEFAAADDAETFGAAALGLSRDDYYAELCELADQLGVGDLTVARLGGHDGCASGGCGCH
ncbi:MAG: hypothetical protein HY302_09975 [Opitutae bacterium]|nr:hypothetical protein [Opitutae bacterium]